MTQYFEQKCLGKRLSLYKLKVQEELKIKTLNISKSKIDI